MRSVCLVVVMTGIVSAQAFVLPAGPYLPGQSYTGRNGYIRYLAGNLPLIFSVPHGGSLLPDEIPTRTAARCTSENFLTLKDLYTRELALEIRKAFFADTGRYPHVIINRLHRQKLDANRPMRTGACRDPEAQVAWTEYHEFIDRAADDVLESFGRGWYTDLHGHGHTIPRIELGYEVSADDLRLSDRRLDADPAYESKTAFRTFSQESPLSFSALLRGPTSLGTLLANAGFPAVPSRGDPFPDPGEPFYSTGYSDALHGCAVDGFICGVQLEINLRPRQTQREAFAAALVQVYRRYLAQFDIVF